MHIGLELALTGMGTVFTFLVLLIFVTHFMSRMVLKFDQSRFAAQPQKPEPLKKRPLSSRHQDELPPELLTAVVTAAIHQHRAKQSQVATNRD